MTSKLNKLFKNDQYLKVKKNIIYLFIFIFVVMATQKLYCQQLQYVYYYEQTNTKMSFKKDVILFKSFDDEQNIKILFKTFLEKECLLCVPEGMEINDVKLEYGHLYLDFNENILDHGGNYYESVLLSQIYKNAFSFESVKSVTILINGEQSYLPEGQETVGVTEFEDLSY